MDVIGVGFGRTGTLSLKAALERLGFGPCMHMLSLLDDAERSAQFRAAAEGDEAALAKALAGCRSTVDWPGVYFWRELVERNPAAKVVLTVRDPHRWYDSMERTILLAAEGIRKADDQRSAALTEVMAMTRATVWNGTFGGRLGDRDHAIKIFQDHIADVRRVVPAERLLVFEVTEGWEPLCSFLGVPAPGEAFPRLNDTAEFQARLARRSQPASVHR
jgi:hypothetical protein